MKASICSRTLAWRGEAGAGESLTGEDGKLRWTPSVAPIAVSATAGSTSLLHLINIKCFVGCGACGYVGEGERFPAFRAGSGGGGSGAGRQSRSSIYPKAFEPGADASLGLGHCRIGVEVDLFLFEAAPQSLDKDVVHAPALAVHADHDAVAIALGRRVSEC